MRELVLIHWRSQENKDSDALKKTWVEALHQNFANAGLTLEIDNSNIHFPYFGDTLIQLINGVQAAASIVVKGGNDGVNVAEAQLMASVVEELLIAGGSSRAAAEAAQTAEEAAITPKGPLNWGWVLAGLRILNDRGLDTLALEVVTRDVYRYVIDQSVSQKIDHGVAKAISGRETVVVGHSLGTVVVYSVLSKMGEANGWHVPAFITLGSPLAIRAVNRILPSVAKPTCIGSWYNGRDPKDTVALFPLAPDHFPDLGIIAKDTIDNESPTIMESRNTSAMFMSHVGSIPN